MVSFELLKSIEINASILIVNKDSVSVIDSYTNSLSIVLPNYTVVGPCLLGFEDTRDGTDMMNFSDSVTTDKGFYISSFRHDVRIRDEYHDQMHYEVVRRDCKIFTLGTFSLNSRNHLYTLDDDHLIVYDANEYEYSGGTNPCPLKKVFEVQLEDEEQQRYLTIDTFDNVYTAADGGHHVNVYDSSCNKIIATIDAPSDVCSIKAVGDKLYVGTCESLEIYHIKMDD